MYSFHSNSSTAETLDLCGEQHFLIPQWGMGVGQSEPVIMWLTTIPLWLMPMPPQKHHLKHIDKCQV